MKYKIFNIIAFLFPLIFVEIFLRIICVEVGHTTLLLNKPWYIVPPIGVPSLDSDRVILQEGKYRIYDGMLGWKLGKNGSDPPLYFSSKQNFRISENEFFSEKPDVLETDVITIGDSFTHGDEVIHESSWPYLLEKKSRLKCINYGVGGYGIDQAVLSYKYSNINTKYVILGVISGDFERATQILYKGIYHGGTKSKPMFDFSDENKVKIINQPALYGNELIEEFKKGTESTFLKSEKSYNKKILEFDFLTIAIFIESLKCFGLGK